MKSDAAKTNPPAAKFNRVNLLTGLGDRADMRCIFQKRCIRRRATTQISFAICPCEDEMVKRDRMLPLFHQ